MSQTKFDELKGNIRNNIQVYENYNNQKFEFIIETAIKDKEFSVVQYNDLKKLKLFFMNVIWDKMMNIFIQQD